MSMPNPLADQLDMTYRDVARFEDSAELAARDQAKIDRMLDEHRARMSATPLLVGGVLGGPDGTYVAGNPDACHLAYRGSSDLPKYDPDNPHHTQIPFIIPAWNLNHEWAVRAPSTIEDIIGGFAFEPRQPCNWHHGPPERGARPPGVMVRAQGQSILLLYVCGLCRGRLEKAYGNGLLFLELDDDRRIKISARREF